MRAIRGEHRHADLEPRRYADHWISATAPDGHAVFLHPTEVVLSPAEIDWFTDPDRADPAHTGNFWTDYRLEGRHFLRIRSRGSGGGGVVLSDDAVQPERGGQPDGDRSTDAVTTPAVPTIGADSAEADMLSAVHSGSVIHSARTGRSGWQSPFHAAGFRHIGLAIGAAWTQTEQAALDMVSGLGLAMIRQETHWVLTPAGREAFWRLHPAQGS